MSAERGTLNKDKPLPLWLQRLDRQAESLKFSSKPSSPAAGLRLAIDLSELGWRHIRARLRARYPGASERELHLLAYQQVKAWEKIRDRWRFRSH